MAHGENEHFEWKEGTPKWDDTRKKIWLCWEWSDMYWSSHLDHFEIQIRYTFKNANGGIETQSKEPESLSTFAPGDFIFNYYWEVPDDVISVKFSIKPISETNSGNGNSEPYFETDPWDAPWFYCGSAVIPSTPSAPSVTRDNQLQTQLVLGLEDVYSDELNINVTHVEFQTVVFRDSEILDSGSIQQETVKAGVDEFGNARHLILIGNFYGYKFRCRLCATKDRDEHSDDGKTKWAEPVEVYSEWSPLTEMILGVPETPSLTVRKFTDTTIEYNVGVIAAHDHYQIQSAATTSAFASFDEWERLNPSFKEDSEERTSALARYGIINERSKNTTNDYFVVSSLEAGRAFWRVRSVSAASDGFYSSWSEPVELKFGEELRAPIVQMGQVFANLGDPSVQLRIMHNSPNGSPTSACDIYLGVNATAESHIQFYKRIYPSDMTVQQENTGHYTYYYNLNIQDPDLHISEECYILWRAVTYEGNASPTSASQRSPFSEILTLWIYEKPTLTIILDTERIDEEDPDHPKVFGSFPIHYTTSINLYDKKVISWSTRILACENYYGTGKYGERVVVKKGDVIYNNVDTTTPDALNKYINANDVTLYSGIKYALEVSASLNTGTIVTKTELFEVETPTVDYAIECLPSYNYDNISLGLLPSAVKYEGTGLIEPEHWEHNTIVAQLLQYGYYLWYDYVHQRYSDGSNNYKYNTETNLWEKEILNNTSQFQGSAFWDDGLDTMYCNASKWNYETQEFEEVNWTNLPQGSSFNPDHIWHGVDGKVYYTYYDDKYVLEPGTTTWSSVEWEDDSSIADGAHIWDDGINNYYSNGTIQCVLNSDMTRWTDVSWSGIPRTFKGNQIWKRMGHIYYSFNATQLELVNGAWVNKTWNGKSTIRGNGIGIIHYGPGYWDRKYTYCDGYKQYVLDESTDTWEVVTEYQKGVPCNVNGYYTWHCDDDIYSSYNSDHYKYDKENNRWDRIEYDISESYTFIYGQDVWYQGDHIYYSSASAQYEYIKDRGIWTDKTWYQWTSFDGKNVWYVGDRIYYSSGTAHFELNVETDTWYPKTWQGLDSYYGQYIWYHNGHIYYSYGATEYELNVDTGTWEVKTWTGIDTSRMLGTMVWSDGKDYYHSYDNGTYKLISESAWQLLDWEDGIVNGSCVWFDGEHAHYTINEKDYIFYPAITSEAQRVYARNVVLAVYRKNDDGTFVTIAENIQNTEAAFVTDPHPTLDGAEYRIVATDMNTGTTIFYDTQPFDMKCTDIIIQWDEDYADIPYNQDPSPSIRDMGNFIRLPYNIDVSETGNIENSMVNYIGRKNPVSYYGTQTGYTASWSTEIPKYDKKTIKMLRKLQVYPGDVYVREPSGTGYWANVKVTFPINHLALTVAVSLDVTRVEGGK